MTTCTTASSRGWLRDPAPLFRTNVEGTRNVLDVAKEANLRRFVFTSSDLTVGRRRGHRANGFTTNGGLAEYAVNHVNTLYRIPDDVSYEEATVVMDFQDIDPEITEHCGDLPKHAGPIGN